ncbi:hypothetical protein OS493_027233 [Desmophyllum pertusum]|uniref:Uncharacterized protein n=1 Tax=Desmophyllum pertusum TaxID=174260 RepID=A0A9W9ZMD1_9CNID|nr:hypothetical protein OS493_027233 [Desmophyllum pertusum]
MNEVKRRTKSKYFEQEIWNNVLKQNSFECRRLNLKYHKLEKDESITVKSWNQEQLLMLRKNKKLRDLMAGSAGSTEHFTQRSNELSPSKYLSLPPLTTAQRPHSTASCTQGTTSSGLLTGSTERPRPARILMLLLLAQTVSRLRNTRGKKRSAFLQSHHHKFDEVHIPLVQGVPAYHTAK